MSKNLIIVLYFDFVFPASDIFPKLYVQRSRKKKTIRKAGKRLLAYKQKEKTFGFQTGDCNLFLPDLNEP